jgi:uncharacterized integral membrane protein
MQTLTQLVIALVMAAWLLAMVLLSIQNVAPVSLKFLLFESIDLPIGLLLTLCLGGGLVLGAWIGVFRPRPRSRSIPTPEFDELDDLV